MNNNYSNISLNTLLTDLNISPKMKLWLEQEGMTTVQDLLEYVRNLNNRTEYRRNKFKNIKLLASEISSSRPDLVLELEKSLGEKVRRNITLGTTIDLLDWPEDVKQDLKIIGIKNLAQLIEKGTVAQLKAKGLSLLKINKILKLLDEICVLVPEVKIALDMRNANIEQEKQQFSQLLIKDLKWLTPNVVECLNIIGVKTLGEFADVIKDDFKNFNIESGKVLETIKCARRVEKWIRDENSAIPLKLQLGEYDILMDVRYFAPWWIKELYDVGIYSINGIVECGGEYGLEKRGIGRNGEKSDYIKGIWSAVEAFSKTSPKIQRKMDERRAEIEEMRKKCLKVPLYTICGIPERVQKVIQAKRIELVGELLEVKRESLSGIELTECEKNEVMYYIRGVTMLCNNGDLESILLPEYNIDSTVVLDNALLEIFDIKSPQLTGTQIANLTRKKRNSICIAYDLSRKASEANEIFRKIVLNKHNHEKD